MTTVLMVSYDDSPPEGGQGVVIAGMREGLVAAGATVHSLSGRGDHAIPYSRLLRRAPLDLSLHLWRHASLMHREDVDVVHAHGGPGGVILLRRLDRPLVYTAHHTYRQAHPLWDFRRAVAPLEARAYRRADRVLAVSESTAAAVRACGVAASRVEVLSPGVSIPDADESRRERGRMLFAGRWEREKGVLDALAVMAAVADRRRGAHGVVIGSGSLDGVVHRVAARQPEGRISVLGRVDDAALREEYARAEIVVMPSQYEGLGLVALEALAHGCVVVGYDVDGLRDAAAHGAVLVERGDRRRLADACLRLIDDRARREQLAAKGRAAVVAEHSWDQVARRLLEIYAEVSR